MIRLAILISGSGTTMEAILKARERLSNIEPVVVVSSRPDAGGIIKAKKLGIPTQVVERKKYASDAAFGRALLNIFQKYTVDIISQNGWMILTPSNVIATFAGRIINQHPGPLDPGRGLDFGGKGMYGRRVTAARVVFCKLCEKDYWTEATVHHATDIYDTGELIRVEKLVMPQLKTDSVFHLTQKVAASLLPLEHKNVIESLKEYGRTGAFPKYKRKTPLVSKKERLQLSKAKEIAIQLFPSG